MHKDKEFLEKLKYMNKTMKADNAAGHQWKYCNTTSKKAKNFESARRQGKYLLNCVDGVQWAAKLAGIPSDALAWYGSDEKIAWCGSDAKANCKKYFKIIKTGGKTVKKLVKSGEVLPGDILLGYQGMSHTNAYMGNEKSFDSGHAYCTGSGEGAKFRKWIGSLAHASKKVNYILRLKDHTQYRVQCGAFTDMAFLLAAEAQLHRAGFQTKRINEGGMIKLQAGLFDYPKNADALVKKITSAGLPAIVKEV